MQLRCQPGDLALVLSDTPPCESNVGRFVHARRPVHLNHDLRLVCWLIKPVSRTAWCVEVEPGEVHAQIVTWHRTSRRLVAADPPERRRR
jgi:hypothetical protein